MANRAEKRRRERQQGSGGRQKSSSRMNWILMGVGILAILIVAWNLVFSTAGEGVRQPVEITYGSTEELVAMAQGVELGDPDAPITIMDFSDYQCPSCRMFATQVKPFLQADFIDDGLASFVYYDFALPTFPHSFLAARAARCAGDQNAYWGYHDRLFQAQPEWSGQADPFSTFVGYGDDLGLDRSEFRACLGSDRYAETVTANIELGRRLGVSGTPTIFLDTGEGRGERVEDWSAAEIRPRIRQALARLGYDGETSESSAEESGADR